MIARMARTILSASIAIAAILAVRVADASDRFDPAPLSVAERFGSASRGTDTFTYVDRDGYRHEIRVPGGGSGASDHAAPPPLPPPPAASDEYPFAAEVREAASVYSLPVELILAVMTVESGFDPKAISPVGAMGLMQIMPATATEVGVTDAFDPRQSALGGARYLRILVNGANGDVARALAGYHAGSGATARHGGVPPYPDTQRYVADVIRFYQLYLSRGPEFASTVKKAIRARQPIPTASAPASVTSRHRTFTGKRVASPEKPVVPSPAPRAKKRRRAGG